jgi:hypothetical protein
MAWPASLTLVTVSVQADLPPSGGATGWITFSSPAPLLGETLVPPFTQRLELGATGAGTIQLPATNDPQWSPVGWSYTVRGRIEGETFTGTLQLDYADAAVDLEDLLQIDGGAAVGVSYLLTSRRGVAGGVAGLDDDGDVIDAAGDKITGGAQGALLAANNLSDLASASTARTNLGTVAKSGDTFTGDVTVANGATPTKAYRLKVSGGALDFDAAGTDLYLSTFPNPDFSGTQRTYARFEAASQFAQLMGRYRVASGAFSGTGVADLDSSSGIAGLGLANGLTNVRFAGFKATAGAPSSSTWTAGDVVLDSRGLWYLCTAGGTPGTWVTPGAAPVISSGYVTTGNVSAQTTATFAALTGGPTVSVSAAVGERLAFSWSGLRSTVPLLFWDTCVLAAGSPVRYASSGTGTAAFEGDPGMYPDSAFRPTGGGTMDLVVEAGDLSGGTVTFGVALINPAGGGTLYASSQYPWRYRVINYGGA